MHAVRKWIAGAALTAVTDHTECYPTYDSKALAGQARSRNGR